MLSERTGRIAAQLMGYGGARMLQDNCLWKPPGARSLGMHQDGSFADYLVPSEMITCWVALDDTRAEGGTIEYARGSHRWPKVPPDRGSFHAPEDWLAPMRSAAPEGVEPELVPVVVKAGGCSFHHSLTFHGSGPNEATRDRRAIVSHLIASHTRFHPTNVDQIYSRYRRRGDLSMDESFFPVLWDESGARSAWLAVCRSSADAPAAVAPAVEQQRRARAGARVLDPARGTASGRRPSRSARRAPRSGRARRRRAASRARASNCGLGQSSQGRPAKRSDSVAWLSHSTLTP